MALEECRKIVNLFNMVMLGAVIGTRHADGLSRAGKVHELVMLDARGGSSAGHFGCRKAELNRGWNIDSARSRRSHHDCDYTSDATSFH
jgi:hypothetical protein